MMPDHSYRKIPAPNEKFDIIQFENGMETVAHFFHEYAAIKS